MADNNIAQKVGSAALGLGMLVQSLIPGTASAIDCQGDKFYNKRTGETEVCRPLPDVSGCKYLGQKGPTHVVDSMPGNETTLKGYQCGNTQYTLYTLPNGKIYGFATNDVNTRDKQWYWDYENDGNFEQVSRKGMIEEKFYGY